MGAGDAAGLARAMGGQTSKLPVQVPGSLAPAAKPAGAVLAGGAALVAARHASGGSAA